jgi:hypothetical protein
VAPAGAQGGGGARPNSVAQSKLLQQQYTATTPDQTSTVSSVSNPPRPPTAA